MHKRILPIVISLVVFFCAYQISNADEAYLGTTDWDTSGSFFTVSPYTDSGVSQSLGSGLNFEISKADIMWYKGVNYLGLSLDECSDSDYDDCVSVSDSGNVSPGGSWGWQYDISMPAYTLTADKYYRLRPHGGGTSDLVAVRWDSNGSSPNDKLTCLPGVTGDCGSLTGVSQMAYTIYGNPPPGATISVIRPENATSTTNEAYSGLFWGVSVDPADDATCSTTNPCRVAIKYWKGTSTEALADPGVLIDYDAIYSTSTIDEKYFDKSFDIANGTWSAVAYLYSGFNYPLTTVVSSTIISFEITSSTVPGGVVSTSTLAEVEIACSSGNWFSNGLCGVFSFLFYPPAGSLNMYDNLAESIKYKPPIGYLVFALDALSGITNGTSSIELINASTSEAFDGVFSPVKTGASWLLWLALGFFIFNRIRNIDI